MPEPALLRPFRADDLPELQAMVLALYGGDAYGRPMTAAQVSATAGELARRPARGRIMVAERDGRTVGYAIVVFFWSNEHGGTVAILDELFVKAEHRGAGLGSAMLAELEAAARAEGVRGLLLEVAPENTRARDLYLRHGFAPVANRHLFRPLD